MACCEQYQSGIDEIDRFVTLAHVRQGDVYRNPPFKYCPWCGEKQPDSKPTEPTKEQ